jgi:hypothetical protein
MNDNINHTAHYADETERAVFMPSFAPVCCKSRPPGAIFIVARRKVYIASPFRGDTETNVNNARRYARFAYARGYLPIAPHLYLPQFLDDGVPDERATALAWGLEALAACRELWVFGETVSEGMAKEIREARRLRIPVRHFTAELKEVTK